ncbi:MAG: 4-(cytidine 5'-diphospho)-2-C-methyl-D-erythritol kinase [Bacteroidetes bacterium]|nr:4-(cytidine 5'-diphospho)-2-C-methyl-D-erythritol kinase [Bacteroidota bacterium]
MLEATAPAKINFGLHILRRRNDGFHDLSTVFHPLEWVDTLTATHADQITMTCTDPSLSCGDDNLVIRAAKLLKDTVGTHRGALIHLDKNLPHGAGLGGGSSDAATTLNLLMDLWEIDKPSLKLESLALELGSDVPFFLYQDTAYAEGRGELLTPLKEYRFPYTLVLIVHPIHISTAWAFQQIQPFEANRQNLMETVRSNDLDRWKRELVNDFEEPVFSSFPILRDTKSFLMKNGAGFASLSGSGSGMFGVFESHQDALQMVKLTSEWNCITWCQPPTYEESREEGVK